LSKEARKSMVVKWNFLLSSLPNAEEVKPSLKWCCFNQFTAPFDLLILSTREEYDLAELRADIPQSDWPRYFEKVAFTISNLTAEEYAQKLYL
jgi:hypothetical protein